MTVNIEIDGKKLAVRQGQMIIEVADEIGITIPRFCYHKKLSIAANCRMCLVQVSNAPKPLPACATPVSEGMKVFTTSPVTVDAQKSVMEFLLINHPLDCPICDQGGQCELQDVAMEYGKDFSRYEEPKRVVKDKNIGPLISTEMTRCIHCTRCVRFGTEIAGSRELGATGRGEFMQIGTFVEKSVDSELSGNVIDLCPVGALTSKPFRFQARAWEIQARASISPHDCLGSHVFFNIQHNKVVRTLPREQESINEVWLSDRDRFSYEALNHADRLTSPWIKRNGQWEAVDWATALPFAIEKLQAIVGEDPNQLATILSPNCTLEEFYLVQKLLRQKNCRHIDHRLRQQDFRYHDQQNKAPGFGISLADLEQQEIIVLIGADVRKEQPLLSHRIRKATLHGAKVIVINPWDADLNFSVAHLMLATQGDMLSCLTAILTALSQNSEDSDLDQAASIARCLKSSSSQKISVLLGAYAWTHPQASDIYWMAEKIAQHCHATFGETSNGANSAGGWLMGALPHRLPFGVPTEHPGESLQEMFEQPKQGYLLVHCEPEYDCLDPIVAQAALKQAKSVVVLSAYDNPHFREYADVILPVTPISESAGTYVNAMGDWQGFVPAVTPLGESRPAWKVLRVMGDFWEAQGCAYTSCEAILAEIQALRESTVPAVVAHKENPPPAKAALLQGNALIRLAPTPLYAVDGITRRASALQKTQDANVAVVRIHSQEAAARGLVAGQSVWVTAARARSDHHITLPIEINDRVPLGTALIAASLPETYLLGAPFEMIELKATGSQ